MRWTDLWTIRWPLDRAWGLLCVVLALILTVGLSLLLRPTPRTTPAVFYASPTGTGSTCSETAPCTIQTWTQNPQLARPGATLLLLDGTYRRSQGGTIDPLDSIAGTADHPITVRALHDGQVLLDAESGFAVYLSPTNHYWHIAGINAKNGGEALYRIRGNYHRLERVIGWDGTTGSADSNIFSLQGVGSVVIDAAGWGQNVRKVFEDSQSTAPGQRAGFAGCRRCWLEWNDHPMGMSGPSNTYQLGYRTRQQRFENILGTVRLTGDTRDFEGVVSAFYDCPASDISMAGTAILGALFYLPADVAYGSEALNTCSCASDMLWQDVATVLAPTQTTVAPFRFLADAGSPATEQHNRCENCLSVHAGRKTINQTGSGWTLPGFREGNGLAEATGGQSVYTLLPGLCREYQGGVLSTTPLWPWKMNQRILDARAASGAPPVDVTATVESLLGPIPDSCRWDRQPPIPPQPEPGPIAMTCSGTLSAVPGTVQLSCVQQTGKR